MPININRMSSLKPDYWPDWQLMLEYFVNKYFTEVVATVAKSIPMTCPPKQKEI